MITSFASLASIEQAQTPVHPRRDHCEPRTPQKRRNCPCKRGTRRYLLYLSFLILIEIQMIAVKQIPLRIEQLLPLLLVLLLLLFPPLFSIDCLIQSNLNILIILIILIILHLLREERSRYSRAHSCYFQYGCVER